MYYLTFVQLLCMRKVRWCSLFALYKASGARCSYISSMESATGGNLNLTIVV